MNIEQIADELAGMSKYNKLNEELVYDYADNKGLSNVELSRLCELLNDRNIELVEEAYYNISENEMPQFNRNTELAKKTDDVYAIEISQLQKHKNLSPKDKKNEFERFLNNHVIKPKDFWLAYYYLDYSFDLTGKMFSAAFGKDNGSSYLKRVKRITHSFMEHVCAYRESVRNGSKRDNTKNKNDLFVELKAIAMEFGSFDHEKRFRASIFEKLYIWAYKYTYEDPGNISLGTKKVYVNDLVFLRYILLYLHSDEFAIKDKKTEDNNEDK